MNNNEKSKSEVSKEADDGLHGNNDDLKGTAEGYNSSPDGKYLSLEQSGVTYTKPKEEVFLNSDNIESGTSATNSGLYDTDGKNSRNAEAFNQDENILNTNIDLDEDQSQSISSDEDLDTNIH